MDFYPAFICENGHPIETATTRCYDKFCTSCGAAVISKCTSCNAVIRGHELHCSGYYEVPAYCRNCGKPYPWTESAVQATAALLAEDDSITAEECNRLIEVLPDAMAETPKTQLASVRIKKALQSLGSFAAEGLRQFLIDFGCELVKKQIGLP